MLATQTQTNAVAYREALENLLTLSVEELSNASDRIQKLSRRNARTLALTATCEFDQAARLRRLLRIPVRTWTAMDARWARAIVERVAHLRHVEGPAAALALACMGFERADLAGAYEELEKRAGEGQQVASEQMAGGEPAMVPGPATAEEPSAKKPAKARKAAPAKKVEPKSEVLGSLAELDEDDLDPETKAALEQLKAEVSALSQGDKAALLSKQESRSTQPA